MILSPLMFIGSFLGLTIVERIVSNRWIKIISIALLGALSFIYSDLLGFSQLLTNQLASVGNPYTGIFFFSLLALSFYYLGKNERPAIGLSFLVIPGIIFFDLVWLKYSLVILLFCFGKNLNFKEIGILLLLGFLSLVKTELAIYPEQIKAIETGLIVLLFIFEMVKLSDKDSLLPDDILTSLIPVYLLKHTVAVDFGGIFWKLLILLIIGFYILNRAKFYNIIKILAIIVVITIQEYLNIYNPMGWALICILLYEEFCNSRIQVSFIKQRVPNEVISLVSNAVLLTLSFYYITANFKDPISLFASVVVGVSLGWQILKAKEHDKAGGGELIVTFIALCSIWGSSI